MYTMKLDGRPLFDPTLLDYSLEDPKLSMEANKFGTLTFTIYPNHPEYANVSMKTSRIKVYSDDTLIFEARPAQYRRTLHNGYEWTCEDVLSRLNDVAWRPVKYTGTGTSAPLTWLLGQYNGVIDPGNHNAHLHINAGSVNVSGYTGGVETKDSAYKTFWKMIVENTIDIAGGYLVPIYTEDAGITLNYYDAEHLPEQAQEIVLGENMQDLTIDINTNELFTVLIPLGKDQNAGSGASDKKLPLTIASVNSGSIYLTRSSPHDDVGSYGWIEHTETWSDIDSASDLKTKGQEYLDKLAGHVARTMTINAYDLHDAGVDVAALKWLAQTHVTSSIHNINDEVYPLRRMELSLGEPQASVIEIGTEKETMTDRLRKDARKAQKYYTYLDDRVWDMEDVTP